MQWLTDAGLGYEQAEWILRMTCAMLAGAVLGLDREVRRRRIGVRTYMMVSLGAAVFALIAMEMAADAEISGFAADPSRVLQGLIGGLGFLGAGAIIQGEKNVGGMVTAASIWLSGAVGLAAGLGYFFIALSSAALGAFILAISGLMSNRGVDDRPDTE